MAPRARYSFRKGVALTRAQWSLVLAALIVGVVGLVVAVLGHPIGAALMGLSGMAMTGITLAARWRT